MTTPGAWQAPDPQGQWGWAGGEGQVDRPHFVLHPVAANMGALVFRAEALVAELMAAVVAGDTGEVQRLLDSGVGPNYWDLEGDWAGHCPVSLAARFGHAQIVRQLLRAGATDRAFVDTAIAHGHDEVVRVWLELGEDVNKHRDKDGRTLLMHAAGGKLEVVVMLVEAGADINARTTTGRSALSTAMDRHNDEVVDYLWPLSSPEVRAAAGYIDARGRR